MQQHINIQHINIQHINIQHFGNANTRDQGSFVITIKNHTCKSRLKNKCRKLFPRRFSSSFSSLPYLLGNPVNAGC